MTDWIVHRSFFCLKTTQKLPKIEQNYPNTTLKILPNPPKKPSSKLGTKDYPNTALTLYKALFAQIEQTAKTAH